MKEQLTEVFFLKGAWRVIWRGIVAPHTFTCKEAAEVYLDICERNNKLRS